jgi:hypothetical protein
METNKEGKMGLEKVIHRMATDISFSERVQTDPESAIKAEKFDLSSAEMAALQSVLDKLGSIDLTSLSSPQLLDWYKAQVLDWYKGQVLDWYIK